MNSSFLPGMGPHVGVEGAQVGVLLPVVAGHPRQQRALAVHHLVVRERQHELLGERVDQAEGQLVVVVAAVHRVEREVLERVVHPAHVPLEVEAQAARVGRPRHGRPGGRLLGRHQHARLGAVGHLVELAQEADRLEVLAAAVLVGQPLAGRPRVVAVEHRGHGVHAQPVGVVLAQPVEGARHEEVAHLVAAVVEDQRAPVGVRAAARVRVLVERRAVEAAPSANSSRGKWAGTQSRITPMPRSCRRSTISRRSSGRCRGSASARSRRSPGSPTSPRTGAPSPAAAPRG